jgi:hypothetical protein
LEPQQHRARRYPFVAAVEITDLESGFQLKEQTRDLSLFGCHASARKPLLSGTKVRIRIIHKGANFAALGRVAYFRLGDGMGIAFTQIEQHEQLVLENWIAELRTL